MKRINPKLKSMLHQKHKRTTQPKYKPLKYIDNSQPVAFDATFEALKEA